MVRKGWRVRNRRKARRKIPTKNKLTEEEVKDFLIKSYSVEFVE
jgi:hypothetical protein